MLHHAHVRDVEAAEDSIAVHAAALCEPTPPPASDLRWQREYIYSLCRRAREGSHSSRPGMS